ncbi:hypothetical protein BJX62DRAFT_115272 [Aspergillus germanicus]
MVPGPQSGAGGRALDTVRICGVIGHTTDTNACNGQPWDFEASWPGIIGHRIHRFENHGSGLGQGTDRGEQDRPPPEFMHARSGANSRWLQTISLFCESVDLCRILSSPITPMLQARILQSNTSWTLDASGAADVSWSRNGSLGELRVGFCWL